MITNTVHWVQYAGIQLNLSRIQSFESENVYDEGEVDRTYNHLRIRCSGIANQTVNLSNLSNSAFATYLRTALMEPRKQLIVAINGTPTVNIAGPDANNGPNPINVRVYEFDGTTVFVDFEIEAWEPACPSSGLVVTANRWTQAIDIDTDGYSTLTSSGTISINGNRTDANADFYRGIAWPVFYINQGFQRISQNFEVSSDGNEMTWTVVDREMLVPAPSYPDDASQLRNITRWEGTWAEGTSLVNLGGTVLSGTLSVKAWGQKNTPKKLLLQFCLLVLQQRRQSFSFGSFDGLIYSYEIEEGLNENYVSLTASLYGLSLFNFAILSIQSTPSFGKPIDVAQPGSGLSAITDRGNAGLFLAIKDIVGTCDSKTTVSIKNSQGSANQSPVYEGTVPGAGTKTLSTTRNQVLQDQYPYTHSKIETRNVTNYGAIQLGRASGNPATASFIATMNSPVSKRIVRFETSRLNQCPSVPQPAIAGCTIIHAQIDMPNEEILPSGVDRVYTMRGQYIFAVNNPVAIGTDLIVMPHQITDLAPLTKEASPQNFVAAANFIPGQIA